MSRSGGALIRAAEEHRRAVEELLDTLRRVPPERWRQPVSVGKWSPAQIAQHLMLADLALLRELDGEAPMRMRVAPWMERLLRWIVLPHILFHRSFPLRAAAPREARPEEQGAEQTETVRQLPELADRLRARLSKPGARPVTHPYFGRLDPPRALRFCAIHIEHHRRQVETSAAG